MPLPQFKKLSQGDSHKIIYSDRGPQITFSLINCPVTTNADGSQSDMRDKIIDRANELFQAKQVPVLPAKGGTFSIDFRLAGVTKDIAIKYVLEHNMIPDLHKGSEAEEIEIWGDLFSKKLFMDRYILYAVPAFVRALDFRQESLTDLPEGYNIMFWDGGKHLFEGLLEYLQTYFKS
jgi:hypothetical protein